MFDEFFGDKTLELTDNKDEQDPSDAWAVVASWTITNQDGVLVVSPKHITQDELSQKTFVGTVYSPYYGQVYAFREGLVEELFVDVWDTVTKGQKLGTLTQQTFSPELASMEAEKKSAITAASWWVEAAANTLTLIKNQKQEFMWSLISILWKNNELTVQKIAQLERQQQEFTEWADKSLSSLDILPSSKESLFWWQLDKEIELIKNEVSSIEQSLRNDILRLDQEIALKEREISLKKLVLEQDLIAQTDKFTIDTQKTMTSLRNAYDIVTLIFYNGAYNPTSQLASHFGARDTSKRREFISTYLRTHLRMQSSATPPDDQIIVLQDLIKTLLSQAQTTLSTTTPGTLYPLNQLEIDINRLLKVNLDDVSGITTTNSALEKQRIDLGSQKARIQQDIDLLSLSLDQLKIDKSRILDEIQSLQAGLDSQILEKQNDTLRQKSDYEQQKNEIIRDKQQISLELVQKQQDFDQAVLEAKNDLLGLQSNNQTELIKEEQSYDLMIAQAQWELRIAQAQLKAAQQSYNLFVQWGYNNVITAPFNWTITKRFLTVGQTVTAETPVFDLVDSSKWDSKFVRFDVPEGEFDDLYKGQQIKFLRVQDPVRHYSATISRIANAIDEETKSILVEAQLSDGSEKILIWSTVVVMFEQSWDVSLVPLTSVMEDDSWDLLIWKVVDDIIVGQIVETGKTIWDQIYITSWLNKWDSIVADTSQVIWKETWDTIEVIKWFQASEVDQWLEALGDWHDHEH